MTDIEAVSDLFLTLIGWRGSNPELDHYVAMHVLALESIGWAE